MVNRPPLSNLSCTMPRVRAAAVAVTLAAAATLGGCIDLDERITFEPDGGVRVVNDVLFAPQFNDIMRALEVRAKHLLADEDLANGLCAALNDKGEESAPPGVNFQATQRLTPDGLLCSFDVAMERDDYLAFANATSGQVFQMRDLDDGTTRIEFDLRALPDLSTDLAELIRSQLEERLGLTTPEPSKRALDEILNADRKAYAALTDLMFGDHGFALVVEADQIVETNGIISEDGRSARFEMSYVELVDNLLNPVPSERASFSVVFQRSDR